MKLLIYFLIGRLLNFHFDQGSILNYLKTNKINFSNTWDSIIKDKALISKKLNKNLLYNKNRYELAKLLFENNFSEITPLKTPVNFNNLNNKLKEEHENFKRNFYNNSKILNLNSSKKHPHAQRTQTNLTLIEHEKQYKNLKNILKDKDYYKIPNPIKLINPNKNKLILAVILKK